MRTEEKPHIINIAARTKNVCILLRIIARRYGILAEFKQSQAYLYRLLEAAQTEKVISPIGEKKEIPESQLRPLAKLKDNPDQQREAWAKAVETASGRKVTMVTINT